MSINQCHIDHADNVNNGLITKVWGGPAWTFLHSVTFGYPIEPSDETKQQYKQFFVSLGDVLPCKYCRESYRKFITEGVTALMLADLSNRETLTHWFYRVHNAVNHKLDVDYGITYLDVVNRFESFRAKCGSHDPTIKGCVSPLDYKAFSFKKLNQKDCQIIPLDLAKKFAVYAKFRGLSDKYFKFIELATELNGDIEQLKTLSSWSKRNAYCQKLITMMREEGIKSTELGLPTISELKLILQLCSNMSITELVECSKKLNSILE